MFAETLGPERSDQDTDRALRKLASLGLMQPTESGRRMHTLLAEFARLKDQEAEESVLPALAEAMVGLTTQALESGLPEKMGSLREHLDVIAQAAEKAELRQTGALLSNFGVHLKDLADYEGARSAIERALKIDEKVYGPDHPDVARDVNNLGRVLQDLGDFEEARKYFERALKIDEQVYGPDHPDVARDVNNLGRYCKTWVTLKKPGNASREL